MTLKCKLFLYKDPFVPSDYNKSNAFYEQQKAISQSLKTAIITIQPGSYLFKVNNRNTKNIRTRCERFLKLTVSTSERCQ